VRIVGIVREHLEDTATDDLLSLGERGAQVGVAGFQDGKAWCIWPEDEK
jgi:hypothetical protein